jgi:hypothetical protein
MKTRILILAAILATGAAAVYGQMFAQMFGDSDFRFTSTGHSAGWAAPFVTAATLTDAQVTWIAPDGTITNAKAPAVAFFYPAGTYRIRTADWTKITRLSFNSGADETRNFLTAIPNASVTLGRLTGITTMEAMFRGQSMNFGLITAWPLDKWTNCTTMSAAFQSCTGLTGSIPDLSKMTLCNSMHFTFYGCSGLTGSIPDLSKMTLCATMTYTFYGCSGLTGSIPDLSKMTLCNSMSSAFSGCSGLTGSIPDLSKMTLCTSISAAFQSCTGLTGSIPDLSKMTLCTSMPFTFYGCTGLTGNVDVFTGNMTNLTTSAYCWYGCVSLSGAGSNFIGITKSPSYTVGTASTNSSYRTFYNCTNLSDWATIPADYK